jgi:aspartyl protease family protein
MKELPSGLKMATVWLLAGLAVVLGVQAFMSQQRATRFETVGDSVQIRRAADGHYHWPAPVNGRAVDFLVDTGATRSALATRRPAPGGPRGQRRLRGDVARWARWARWAW